MINYLNKPFLQYSLKTTIFIYNNTLTYNIRGDIYYVDIYENNVRFLRSINNFTDFSSVRNLEKRSWKRKSWYRKENRIFSNIYNWSDEWASEFREFKIKLETCVL